MLSRLVLTRHSRTAAVALGYLEISPDFTRRRRKKNHRHDYEDGHVLTHRSSSRFYHQSGVRLEEELSEKDKKKLLKAKLKAAMAEKEKAEEKDASDEDPKAKLRAKLEAKKNQADSTKDASSTEDSSSPSGEAVAATEQSNNSNTESATVSASSSATPAAPVPPSTQQGPKEYSYPELTADAAKHKAGLSDPTRPSYQNPLHHNNPDMSDKVFEEDFDSKEEFEKAVLPAPALADADGNLPFPQHIQELADEMVNLTMLEYNELINKMADHFGFHEGQLAPNDDDGDGNEEEEEAAPAAAAKTAFDVKLVSYNADAKIKIIKEIRTIVPGLGLKEAKALVESAPVTLQKGMTQEAADAVKAKLVELGAVVEIE